MGEYSSYYGTPIISGDYEKGYKRGFEKALEEYKWHSVDECMPEDLGEEWVLVLAFSDSGFKCTPTVAKYHNGHWWNHNLGSANDSLIDYKESPLKVKYWKKIYDEVGDIEWERK